MTLSKRPILAAVVPPVYSLYHYAAQSTILGNVARVAIVMRACRCKISNIRPLLIVY